MAKTPSTVPNRSCRYCKAKFKPIREDQRFCKPAHRKSFWKYGGLPFDKMKEQIMKDVRKLLPSLVSAELDSIAAKTRTLLLSAASQPASPQPRA